MKPGNICVFFLDFWFVVVAKVVAGVELDSRSSPPRGPYRDFIFSTFFFFVFFEVSSQLR